MKVSEIGWRGQSRYDRFGLMGAIAGWRRSTFICGVGDAHHGTKRQLGRVNYGLYCNGCDEFFAMAIGDPLKATEITIISDGSPMFQCRFCDLKERRQTTEIAQIVLTERLKRRPPPPPGAH